MTDDVKWIQQPPRTMEYEDWADWALNELSTGYMDHRVMTALLREAMTFAYHQAM